MCIHQLKTLNAWPSKPVNLQIANKLVSTVKHQGSNDFLDDPNEKTTVILGARQSSNELEDLKHKLQTHLNTNFRELLRIHDIVYKIRCRAVELHRDDLNHFISSVQRSISTRFGRRCSSVGPMMHTSDAPLPLYTRRRSRSLDVGIRSRVVNSVGVRYVQCPSLSDQDYVEAMKKQGMCFLKRYQCLSPTN